MMLVPTLQRMVDYTTFADFWVNHEIRQEQLDRQNEGEMSYGDYCINRMVARMLSLK